jgi:hypothetical protein
VVGIKGFAGGVEIGVGPGVTADAVAVELLADRAEQAGDGDEDMLAMQLLDDLAEDRGGCEVDVADGCGVKNQPVQRACRRGEDGNVLQQPGGVGIVQAGAEPVDCQSRFGPPAGVTGTGFQCPAGDFTSTLFRGR